MVVGPAQWGTCICTVFHVAGTSALTCWNNNIATAGPTLGNIIILDALTGSQTATLSGHTDYIYSLTYSSDGLYLISGSKDRTIKLWDVQTGGVIKTLCSYTQEANSVSISADATMIASAYRNRAICLWNIKTENCCVIGTYEYRARSVTFSPTNSQLLFSSGDGTVQQWDISGHRIGSPVPGSDVTFSPDGTQFASQKEETVTVRNTNSKMAIMEFNLDSRANYCCFSPNGKFIAVASVYAIYIWNIAGPEPCLIQALVGHSGRVTSLVFSSPYSLISTSFDKSIKFWQIDASSADPVLPDSKPSSPTSVPIKSVSLQTRDGLAFSIDEAGVVRIWDILTGYCKESYKTQIEGIQCADIQLISNRLIIVWGAMYKLEINIWDAEKGKLRTISTPDGSVQSLRMIGDGSRVLQLSEVSIWAWNIWTGKSVYREKLGNGIFDALRMDGSKVLIRFGESSVQGWDFGTPGSAPIQFSETFSGRPHLNFVDVREWSENSPVRIEDGVTGKEVFQLYGKYAEPSVAQWDGWYLIAGYDSGEVLILDFSKALS